MTIKYLQRHFDAFVRHCCILKGWTPFDAFQAAFHDYCLWYTGKNELVDYETLQELLKNTEGRLQGTSQFPVVVGFTIQTWVRFPSCIHCSKVIQCAKQELSYKPKHGCNMSFCSDSCFNQSGLKELEDEWNDEEFFEWHHEQFDATI